MIIVGGEPIPIDPWGPLRHSLWSAMANPHDAPPAVRDALVGLAMTQLTSLVSSPKDRRRLERAVRSWMDDVADRLPGHLIR